MSVELGHLIPDTRFQRIQNFFYYILAADNTVFDRTLPTVVSLSRRHHSTRAI